MLMNFLFIFMFVTSCVISLRCILFVCLFIFSFLPCLVSPGHVNLLFLVYCVLLIHLQSLCVAVLVFLYVFCYLLFLCFGRCLVSPFFIWPVLFRDFLACYWTNAWFLPLPPSCVSSKPCVSAFY